MARGKTKSRKAAATSSRGSTGPKNSKSARGSARRREAQENGYRSAFEYDVARQAEEDGIGFEYEPKEETIEWTPKTRTYLPDFRLENGILIETKGRLTREDRQKLLRIAEQYPDLDLRLVFAKDNTLNPSSPTRYSKWAEKHGFEYAIGQIPPEWAEEG